MIEVFFFYVLSCGVTIELLLRRTLVRSVMVFGPSSFPVGRPSAHKAIINIPHTVINRHTIIKTFTCLPDAGGILGCVT